MSDWHKEATYKSMIEISISVLKFTLLANGGAVVALLSLVGATASGDNPITNVEAPLRYFLMGFVLGGLAHCFSYFTQLALYMEDEGDRQWHRLWLILGIASVIGSLLLFTLGSLSAVKQF